MTLTSDDYAVWLTSLKAQIQGARVQAALSVNRELVRLYHRIGTEILDRQREQAWGARSWTVYRATCAKRFRT